MGERGRVRGRCAGCGERLRARAAAGHRLLPPRRGAWGRRHRGPAVVRRTELEELQTRLGRVWSMNQPGGTEEHVVVELPSFSLAPAMMAHYSTRLVPLE